MTLPILLTNWLLVACSSFSGAYHGVVVDATTNKPLPGVRVENLLIQNQPPTYSDATGHIKVAVAPVHLRLNSIGYASLEIKRESSLAERPDTIRLLPKGIVLENVTVRPAKQIRLTSVPLQDRRKDMLGRLGARGLSPGTKLAVLLLPTDSATTYRISKILIGIPKQHTALAGRLRIQLAPVAPGPIMQPGNYDLLPVATIYTAQQINEVQNQELEVDVASYNLRMPKNGIFVVVECLPSDPNESFVDVNRSGQGARVMAEVVTATDPNNANTYRRTPLADFIWVSTVPVTADAVTWRNKKSGEWIRIAPVPASPANPSLSLPAANALLDLVVEPD